MNEEYTFEFLGLQIDCEPKEFFWEFPGPVKKDERIKEAIKRHEEKKNGEEGHE